MKKNLQNSERLWERAEKTIFSLIQLYDEGSGEHIKGNYPRFIQKGKYGHIWDVDGKEYIDFDMGLGPIILGYCYDEVDKEVINQIQSGMHFSLVSPLDVEYSEQIIQHIPCAQKVRFFKTGSDATEAAIRVARAFSGKKHIIRGDYHGWHEWTVAAEGFRQGGIMDEVRNYVHKCTYNDFSMFEKIFQEYKSDIAAVIIEPVILDKPKDNFLEDLMNLCHDNDALLIFDEVVTGFRFDIGGGQKYLGITPDIAAFGKAAANGLPLSFIAGKKEILDCVEDNVFLFTTFGSERLSIAAGMAVINELKKKNVTERIWNIGKRLKTQTNNIAQRLDLNIRMRGYAPRLEFSFLDSNNQYDKKLKNLFMQECIKRGVFIGWHVFPCYTHTDKDIDYALNVFEDVLKQCKEYLDKKDSWNAWVRCR